MAIDRTLSARITFVLLFLNALAFGGTAVKVNNADFEKADATGNAPEGWVHVQPQNGDGALSLDVGREGGRCAKVTCTRHAGIWGPGMAQLGVVTVEKGKWYELSFWARGEGLTAGAIAALRDTTDWNANQVYEQFHPARSWGRFSMKFRATKDLPAAHSRLQFHFDSTGALWIDDVTLAETEPPKPAKVLDVAGRKNLLPNSSFECGAFGWGTYGADELFGNVDASTAAHGRQSFRIHLAADALPTCYNDFTSQLQSRSSHWKVFRLPLCLIGYAPVKPGRPLTFSAWLKASRDDTAVTASIVEGSGRSHQKGFRVGSGWQRHSFSATLSDEIAFVTVGLDADEKAPLPATLWLDALQLEEGNAATAYEPAFPIEFGLETQREGNVYAVGEAVAPRLVLHNNGPQPASVKCALNVEDFFGKTMRRSESSAPVPPGGTSNLTLNPGISDTGFYRLNLSLAGDGWKTSRSVRLAVVQPFDKAHPGADGFVGINHAFVSDLFMRRARAMGVTWVRSWFAKWQDVEREKGRFDFAEADLQMQWLKRMGCHVLLCLSDPSNEWASTAPTDLKDQTHAESQSRRVWWLPKSFDDYERYVQEVARHFAGQVRHYEVFNEPTDPKGGKGCNLDMGRNYATFIQRARSGARAAGKDNLIFSAGLHYLKPIPDLRPVLSHADVLSEHWYPGLAPTESFAKNIGLSRKAMNDAGCLRPIWITEYGIYADDDPDPTTVVSKFTIHRGKDSERLVATYAVKHHVIALANGVEKIFYHIGNWPFMLNREHGCCFHPFFEWGGAPRKAYVTLNALATRLPPGTRFVRSRKGENALFAFEFASGETHTAILWAEGPASFQATARKVLATAGIRFFDVTGAKQPELPAEPPNSPCYLVATGEKQRDALNRFLDAVAQLRS